MLVVLRVKLSHVTLDIFMCLLFSASNSHTYVTLDHIIFSARQCHEVAGPSADIPSLYTLSVVSLAGLGHALDLSP